MISSPRGILSPTRLAILHYTAPPVIGGVEAILGTHARLLRQAGYDVKVIAGQGGSDPDSKLIPELGSRHPQVEALYQQLGRGEVDRTAFRQLQALLADQLRPLLADRDLVIAHNVLTMPFNLPLAATLAELELPILAWTHDLAWINPRYHNYQRAGYPYDILCQPQPRTTYIAISKLRQQEISKTLGLTSAQISIIPNGVGVADFLGLSSSTRDLMRRGNFGSTWPTLLAPIRITRRKRIELALEAASRLRPNYPGLRLVISGPLGPHNLDNQAYRTKLRALRSDLNLEQSVCFLHELSGPNGIHPVDDQIISELYRLADCILLPSESEGFGLPVLEAALTRTPMVAADLQILRELAKEEIFYFPTEGGASAVVEAVENALSSNPSNLRRHIINQYAWPAVLQKMIAAIQQKFTNHASTKQG